MRSFTLLCSGIGLVAAQAVTQDSTSNSTSAFDPREYSNSDIITRDVAVIGGGSSGTYGAIKLRDAGKSVVVVEKAGVLGGHENTYIDPGTGTAVDYGVQVYWNISVVTNFFARFKIPIQTLEPPTGGSNVYADFKTGEVLSGFNPSTDYTPYANQLNKYPYLLSSWNLPYPIPGDLLLTFGDFIKKYSLQNIAYSIYSNSLGIGNILQQLTVNVFKIFDVAFLSGLKGGNVVTTRHDNGELYVKARAELGSDALLSSTVTAAQRHSGKNGVKLRVQTPTGPKLIIASKLLISIPPLVSTLEPFGLDARERDLFQKWTYSGYYTGLINNTGLTAGTRYVNAGANTLYHIPTLPSVYEIVPTRVPGIYYFWYGSPTNTNLSQQQIQADVTATVQKLTGKSAGAPDFLAYNSHTPFKLVVGADDISRGFYNNLEGLQGHLNTYWTGAAFLSHNSGELWNFTQALIPEITAA